ncbi:MAG: class I SAM-dependent methyltransferase, partial [Treponema sp.]|nr:class I SAM-dependent methyltransferase [Treponema sp.]
PPENGSGSHAVESIDISDFENASIIHDLSMPILDDLKNRFSCVYDGGMLEHVYNYPVALKNAMDMLANGGHLILSTPGNNYFGHGFYQFSAELFYSVLREENGFTNTRVYLNNGRKWYAVKNPRELHARVELSPRWLNARLHVISKKVGEVPINVFSYQSDYEQAWESGIISYNIPQIERIAARLFPILLRKQLGIFYYSLKYRKMFNSYFNKINM